MKKKFIENFLNHFLEDLAPLDRVSIQNLINLGFMENTCKFLQN